jgi:hypothetical protein
MSTSNQASWASPIFFVSIQRTVFICTLVLVKQVKLAPRIKRLGVPHILRQHPPHSFVMIFEVRREEVGAGAFAHLGSRGDHNVPDLNTHTHTPNYIHTHQIIYTHRRALSHLGSRADHNVPDLNYKHTHTHTKLYTHTSEPTSGRRC